MPELTVYFAFPGDLDTPTGGYHYDRRLIEELRKSGMGVETLALPHIGSHSDQQAIGTCRRLLQDIPDHAIVIVDGLALGLLDAAVEAESRRLRLVALCHHPLALETGLDEKQRQVLHDSELRALACMQSVLVTSRHTKQILIDQYAVPAESITVALPGTERQPFSPCDGNPLRLLTMASLIRRKAHDVLISALAGIADLPWQARFAGGSEFDPEWAAGLRAQVHTLNLSPRIQFTGAVENPLAEYQRADLFVLPSRFEGYGMVFAEALAAGLPIVAARAGAVPEVVPESAGLLVPPDDVDALTDALRQILTSDSLRQRLQAGARSAADSLPTWRDTARIVAQTLQQVASS